jgi:hypothetical protein
VDVAAASGDGEPTIPRGAARGDEVGPRPRGLGALGLNQDVSTCPDIRALPARSVAVRILSARRP